MVGDTAACERRLGELRAQVAELLLEGEGGGGTGAATGEDRGLDRWRALVPKFRALRESVTSNQELGRFSLEVYEASAGACLRAGDYGELLKCLQQLLSVHYPAVVGGARPGSEEAAAAGAGMWPQTAAAAVMFFACVPPGGADMLEIATTLRGLPPPLRTCAPVLAALRVVAAMSRGDYVTFFRAQSGGGGGGRAGDGISGGPWAALLLHARAAQARARGVAVMAGCYRQIPAAAAQGMLGLPEGAEGGEAMAALLADAAVRGLATASRALEDFVPGHAAHTIVFKG